MLPLLKVFSFLLLIQVEITSAHPLVAGHCDAGGDLGSKSVGLHGSGGGDSLFLGGITVSIDDISLDTLNTRTLTSDTSYTLKLETKFDFKGFLIRLSDKGGQTVKGTLGLKSGFESISQELDQCSSFVDGICHVNRLVKTSVEVEFLYDKKTSADLQLDITVVKNNNIQNRNDWFFSRFNLQIGEGENNDDDIPDDDLSFVYKLEKVTSPNGDVSRAPTLKTCQWLETQTSGEITSVCTKPRHNKHAQKDGILYGPASNVCSDICSPYCRQEFNKALFIMKVKPNGKFKIQKCKKLKKKKQEKKDQICARSFEGNDSVYSPASEVCTTTCQTTC